MTSESPGRWVGYYVDLNGELHELSDEETGNDACKIAGLKWHQLGCPAFRAMGEAHISQIPRLRAEWQENNRP